MSENLLPHNHKNAQWLSFEWSNFWISSTESNVRITLYRIINSTTGTSTSVASFELSQVQDFLHSRNVRITLYSIN